MTTANIDLHITTLYIDTVRKHDRIASDIKRELISRINNRTWVNIIQELEATIEYHPTT